MIVLVCSIDSPIAGSGPIILECKVCILYLFVISFFMTHCGTRFHQNFTYIKIHIEHCNLTHFKQLNKLTQQKYIITT